MYPKIRVIAHNQLIRLRQHLKQGGICAYPTEYCFGLGGLPDHPAAIRKILRLKKRAQHKGLIVLADRIQKITPYIQPLNSEQKTQIKRYWPGANTLLLPASRRTLPILRGYQHRKLAVRISAHPPSIWLCQQLDSALISTSANQAHARPIKDFRKLKKQFKGIFAIKAPLGKNKRPSTIIDLAKGDILR